MLLHPTSLQFKQNKVLNLALLEFIGFWFLLFWVCFDQRQSLLFANLSHILCSYV